MAAQGNNITEITDQNFEDHVLKSDQPFLLDVGAEWCQPCKALAPVVEELSNEYDGRIRFGTLDIDTNPQVPTRYLVRSVPTLLMFAEGEVVGQLVGNHPRQRIEDMLGKAL